MTFNDLEPSKEGVFCKCWLRRTF